MRNTILVSVVLLLLSAVPVWGETESKPLHIGFVYVSPVEGSGFAYSHDLARRALDTMPGITTSYVENVIEGVDAERVIKKMAQENADIIIATSFGFMDAIKNVASQFPSLTFLHCSGNTTGSNLSTFFGRIYQARFLTGIAAGLMTKSNIIGYVAAYPIPEVIRGINAFTLGARSVNPNVEVHVVWSRTWYDPVTEKAAAINLVKSGADVLTQHQDSPGVQLAAVETGVYAIGYHADMSQFSREQHLTAAVWNWLPFYEVLVAQSRAGTWQPGEYWFDMASGIVDISDFGDAVPESVREQVRQWRQKIIDGTDVVFKGPIENQEGKLVISEGQILSDEDLLGMDWLIKGVVGTTR